MKSRGSSLISRQLGSPQSHKDTRGVGCNEGRRRRIHRAGGLIEHWIGTGKVGDSMRNIKLERLEDERNAGLFFSMKHNKLGSKLGSNLSNTSSSQGDFSSLNDGGMLSQRGFKQGRRN